MKSIQVLFFLLLFSLSGFGQKTNRSIIHFRLSDGQPLMITINGREFRKVNTNITIFDLPGKRHHIRAYKYRAYADGKGGKAELLYSGSFKIQKGNEYDAIIDVNRSILRLKKMENFGQNFQERNRLSPALAPNAQHNMILENNLITENRDSQLSTNLSILKEQINNVEEDSKKLKLAQDFVQKNTFTTSELRNICEWIMFDDNKMKLLKTAYPNLTDRNNFASLKNIFTLPEAQKDFESYAQNPR
ncbi:MAG TPA: DUF4476 domain-containing protein [Edaphocola sp.]|nr:DUF4476 domain-containing protein [Edaphocola sp.]